jgi:hypothetical protein
LLVNTTKGPMDDSLLEKREGREEIDREEWDEVGYIAGKVRVPYVMKETVDWVEYWLDGELVHRSASVTLLPVAARSGIANFT